jgi:catalase
MDSTKVWPEDAYPYTEIGVVTMDKNPENYHRDVEQIAFSPGRLIPGIEPTPDPLLQWRTFLYTDAQLYRLGNNYHQIPVNAPFMAEQHHPAARDGRMRVDANGGHEPHY